MFLGFIGHAVFAQQGFYWEYYAGIAGSAVTHLTEVNPLNGMKDDWFELFNDGTGTVDLTGNVITDTLTGTDPPMPDLRSTKSPPAPTRLRSACIRLTYHLLDAPVGMTLNTDTGLLQWQPGPGQTGTFTFRIRQTR